jgi:hypothetical protein
MHTARGCEPEKIANVRSLSKYVVNLSLNNWVALHITKEFVEHGKCSQHVIRYLSFVILLRMKPTTSFFVHGACTRGICR